MKFSLETSIADILQNLAPGWNKNPDMKETPFRVAKMYRHFFRNDVEETLIDLKKKVFPTDNDQMVIVKDIECFGMCPHHLLPIIYKVHIGYIPKGKAVGLSKLARLAIALSSFPKIQENFTTEIAKAVEQALEPSGVMVVVNGAIAGEKNNKSILYKRLDTLFALAKKNPVTKFHGFGLTIKDLLYRYPFYSVDSTSWIATIRFGMTFSADKSEEMYSRKRNKDKQLEYAVKYFLELEKEITNLWTKRNVIWN